MEKAEVDLRAHIIDIARLGKPFVRIRVHLGIGFIIIMGGRNPEHDILGMRHLVTAGDERIHGGAPPVGHAQLPSGCRIVRLFKAFNR